MCHSNTTSWQPLVLFHFFLTLKIQFSNSSGAVESCTIWSRIPVLTHIGNNNTIMAQYNGNISSLIKHCYFLQTDISGYFHSPVSVVLHSPPRLAGQLSCQHPLEVTFLSWRDCWQQGPSLTWRIRYSYFSEGLKVVQSMKPLEIDQYLKSPSFETVPNTSFNVCSALYTQ